MQQPADVAIAADGFTWPVSGGVILSYFDDPRRNHRHAGVDIRGAPGQEVVAARAGRVVFSGNTLRGYGNMVIVDHGEGMQTLYAHGAALLVDVGDVVASGQPIARVGRTGNATTEHCHFEIRKDKLPVDPLPYLTTVAQARP
jgi:murein DD-endopeptidase MepM/ murein hydrolase activator NlpD